MNINFKTLAAALTLLAAPAAYADTVYGSVIYAGDSENGQNGIFSFNTGNAADITFISGSDNVLATGGGTAAPGYYYLIDAVSHTLKVYDTDTWQLTAAYDGVAPALDLTYDASDNKIYGFFVDGGAKLGTVNIETGSYESIAAVDQKPVTIMSAPSGTLYAICGDGNLYTVSKTSAALTLVGSTGVEPLTAQSATIDPGSGRCYWTAVHADYSSALYEVNLTTGAATRLYDLPGNPEVTGLFTLEEPAAGVPAKVSDLTAEFANGSTTGTVSFKLPALTYDGKPLGGTVNWTVAANDVTSAGSAAPGQTVSVPLTLQSGSYMFTVTASNAEGQGKPAKINAWIGADTPMAPADVTIEMLTPTKARLSWSAPAGGVHGGYVNAGALTYNVTRFPGNAEVMAGGSALTLTDEIPASKLTSFRYVVTASACGPESAEATSPRVTVGPAGELPFTEDFSSVNSFNLLMIADGNADGSTFTQNIETEQAIFNGGAADEWLIIPAMKLNEKANMQVAFNYVNSGSQPYTVEICTGALPNVKDMAPAASARCDASTSGRAAATFYVERSGNYYLALHLTGGNGGTLALNGLEVSVVGSTLAPAAPASIKAVAHEKGKLGADLTIRAPAKTIDGNDLTANFNLTVARGETNVKEFTDVKPGQVLSFTDNSAQQGFNTYTACASNAEGAGQSASAVVYVGIDTPKEVINPVAREVSPGTVKVTWSAPTEGLNGGYVDPKALRYTVMRNDWKEIATDIEATEVTEFVSETNESQYVVGYQICAASVAGKGASADSNILIVGAPYETPFTESFAGGRASFYPWLSLPLNSINDWSPVNTDEADNIEAADGDAGALRTTCLSETPGELELISPKVRIGNTLNPVMQFNITYSNITSDIQLRLIADGGEPETVKAIKPAAGTMDWQTITLPLTKYAGAESVQLSVYCPGVVKGNIIGLDAFTVTDNIERNLAAGAIIAPVKLYAGKPGTVSAEVRNVGSKASGPCTVNLHSGNRLLASAQAPAVDPGKVAMVELTFTPDAGCAPAMQLAYEIIWADDMNAANNVSADFSVTVEASDLPAPTALRGELTGAGVELSWTAPAAVASYQPTTDTFESYPSFTSNAGDWTMIEGDPGHDSSMEFQNSQGEFIVFPGDYAWDNYTFTVVDLSKLPGASAADGWNCPSGNKFLLTAYSASLFGDGSTRNYVGDYLVSPRLKGCAQEITVNLKSLNYCDYGLESVKILVSSTDNNLSSFSDLKQVRNVPTDWTGYKFQLPEGTQYFAIYAARTVTALFIDDVTYIAADADGFSTAATGYNVYRNRIKLNSEPLTTTTFTDVTAEKEQVYEYAVTAIYPENESALSEPVTVSLVGIAEINGAPAVRIATTAFGIEVENCNGADVRVYRPDGSLAKQCVGQNNVSFNLERGIYLLKVGSQTHKVAVR